MWDEKCFRQLKEYKQIHGDCLVPTKNKSHHDHDRDLVCFAKRIRKNRDSLPHEQLAKLESIGFSWNPFADRLDKQWNESYSRLLSYYRIHGDSNYPDKKGQPTLAEWVKTQRRSYSKGSLSSDRIEKLQSVGFRFKLTQKPSIKAKLAPAHPTPKAKLPLPTKSTPQDDEKWLSQYNKLCAFKKKHGHTLVTYNDDPSLGRWVSRQRYLNQRMETRDDRKRLLNEINFCWRTTPEILRASGVVSIEDAKGRAHQAEEPEEESLSGTRIRKQFNLGWFDGLVISKSANGETWRVQYLDGEEEDMDEEEVEDLAAIYKHQYNGVSKAHKGRKASPSSMSSSNTDQYAALDKASTSAVLNASVSEASSSSGRSLFNKAPILNKDSPIRTCIGEISASGKISSSTGHLPGSNAANSDILNSSRTNTRCSPDRISHKKAPMPREASLFWRSKGVTAALSSENDVEEEDFSEDDVDELGVYDTLSPLFFQLCETIKAASSEGRRKRLPQYEEILTRWISKEEKKQKRSRVDASWQAGKRRKTGTTMAISNRN